MSSPATAAGDQTTAANASRHLRRTRLHAALAAPGGNSITTVYAPAGAGKTDLVVDWIEAVGAGRRSVFVDLAASITARWWQAPLWSPSWWPSWPLNTAELAQALHEGIPEHAGGSVIVVLDGTETVVGTGFLAEVRQLAAGEDRLHVVLLGRYAPPDGSPHPLAHPRVGALRGRDLAFTAAETATLCVQRGLDLPAAVSRRLYAITDGWAAGLVVATAALSGQPHQPEGVLEQLLRTGAGLSEYVMRDVLGRYPADLRQALRDASVVESVRPDLFTTLTGRTDAAVVLADLARDGMFATRLDDTSAWYRYHRLWRAALYTALSEDAPAHARHLHATAADWYTTHGQPAEGLRHALAAADRSSAIRIVQQHGVQISDVTPQAAVTAAAPGPWSSLANDAPLAHAFAVHRGLSNNTADPPSTVRPSAAAVRWETAGPADLIQPSAQPIWRALRSGDHEAAQAALISGAAATGRSPLQRYTMLRLHAVIARMTGRLRDAVRHADALGEDVRANGLVGSHDDGWARLVLAEVAVQRGTPDAAVQHLDALAVQLWQSVPALVAAQQFQSALLCQQQHDDAGALDTVEQLIADGDDALLVPRWAARVLRVELLIATGRLHDAHRRWRADVAAIPASTATITTAKLLLARQPQARIDLLLQPLIDDPHISLFHQVELRLLMAHRANTTGDTQRTTRLVRQAIALADPEQLQHPFHANHHMLAPTLNQLTPPVGGLLSPGEISVVRCLAGHRTIREIADELYLSPNTVKTHVASIYRKLAVHTRRDAVHAALALGILPTGDVPPARSRRLRS
ncbi:LuxR C-terminal-related transcriptional regulator [Dactylosporangium sp. NPDC051485]|uniref:LuxR C-terminal-related transcriptional regulator n=1 Tax=Dactylosporangium sp. NPDC051485 TaxID=3154846 RepID=UPI0034120949